MPAPKKNPLTNLIKKGAKKAVVKVKPKPNLKAEPKSNIKKVAGKPNSNVKKVAGKTTSKTGLENRGARPTKFERAERAKDLQWDKAERTYDNSSEMAYTGLRSYPKGFEKSRAASPGKKNERKRAAIRKQASYRIIKITGK